MHTAVSTKPRFDGTLYFVALLREELGRRIAAARASAGMSQRELADAIGLKNAGDISRYERGKVDVPDFRIDLIAEATGRSRTYFVRDPADPEPAENGRLERLEDELAEMRTLLEEIRDLLGVPPRSAASSR